MQLVDTHCHIQSAGPGKGEPATRELWAKSPELQPDTIIEHATDAGVDKLICVGCDIEDSRLAVEFVKARAGCYASIGIHPHEAQHHVSDSVQQAFRQLSEDGPLNKIVAVGECGLDYYYEHSPRDIQAEVLRFQIELALSRDLPLIFHVREAFDDFWPIFDSYQGIRGVLHSFTDSVENLQQGLERGLYIGVNGIATFAREEQMRVMYRTIPSDRLLLETDSPFLTPNPYRGTINEPKHTRTIAEFLGELRGEDLNQIAQATTRNAATLFRV